MYSKSLNLKRNEGIHQNEIKYMTLGGGDPFFAHFNFLPKKNLKKKQSKKLNFNKFWGGRRSFLVIIIIEKN